MVAIVIVGVLLAIALPSYQAYIQRSKVPEALDALSAYATRMEQHYQDVGFYSATSGGAACSPTPAATEHAYWTVTCALGGTNQSYTATATGSGVMNGYTYTINSAGVRATTAHPHGANAACWTTRGTSCDT
jgi:type IV pilus assembly protein PilE